LKDLLKASSKKSHTAYLVCDAETARSFETFKFFIPTFQMNAGHEEKAVKGEVGTFIQPVTINSFSSPSTQLTFVNRLIVVVDDDEIEKRRIKIEE